ncbi:hypothetical protein Hdeb2414_s0005g00180111 [Helianthus debilis subsp. tardiflorus]
MVIKTLGGQPFSHFPPKSFPLPIPNPTMPPPPEPAVTSLPLHNLRCTWVVSSSGVKILIEQRNWNN